jgi:ABC-type xylose transport system permease subunit
VWAAGGAAVLAGAALGAVNGLLVAGLGLPSIVVTLATLVVWREALRWWREGELVRNLPESFHWFGAGDLWGPWLVVLAAAAVLLVTFGTGPNVDVLGHLFGLLAGGGLGVLGVFLIRRPVPSWAQALLVVTAAATIAGAWRAAL